jgi:hypothetical protein
MRNAILPELKKPGDTEQQSNPEADQQHRHHAPTVAHPNHTPTSITVPIPAQLILENGAGRWRKICKFPDSDRSRSLAIRHDHFSELHVTGGVGPYS